MVLVLTFVADMKLSSTRESLVNFRQYCQSFTKLLPMNVESVEIHSRKSKETSPIGESSIGEILAA